MPGKFAFTLLSLGALAALKWLMPALSPTMATLAAVPGDAGAAPLADSDEDFLPDAVEWAVMANAANPDTDGDGTQDFIEFVQKGRPREPGEPLPTDQEMRVVVTGPAMGAADPSTWLHLFVRLLGDPKQLTGFQAWLELPSLPGLQIPFDFLSLGPAAYGYRETANQGIWMSISVPMASIEMLEQVAPVSIRAQSTIGGRFVETTTTLFTVGGQVSSLVPFRGGFAAQSIAPTASFSVLGGSAPMTSNRVCVYYLRQTGSGTGASVFEIHDAECEDCEQAECSPNCEDAEGWLLVLPGGFPGFCSTY